MSNVKSKLSEIIHKAEGKNCFITTTASLILDDDKTINPITLIRRTHPLIIFCCGVLSEALKKPYEIKNQDFLKEIKAKIGIKVLESCISGGAVDLDEHSLYRFLDGLKKDVIKEFTEE